MIGRLAVRFFGVAMAIVLGAGVAAAQASDAREPQSRLSLIGDGLVSDGKYLANNFVADAEDIVTAPLRISELGRLVGEPTFYYTLIGAGAAWGVSYAFDQTVRSGIRGMSHSDAGKLQDAGNLSIVVGVGSLYAYGLFAGDARAREHALTAVEAAVIATLLAQGVKAAFGRKRPRESPSHQAFFAGGRSFVSGEATPLFAVAAGISAYYDNAWYAALPAYSAATALGISRMGRDAHWFSDIVGAALLGVGTTKLFLWMHEQHGLDSDRYRVFPVAAASSDSRKTSHAPPVGIGVTVNL
jgi:membrane-associated phospholipid phosphatase